LIINPTYTNPNIFKKTEKPLSQNTGEKAKAAVIKPIYKL